MTYYESIILIIITLSLMGIAAESFASFKMNLATIALVGGITMITR